MLYISSQVQEARKPRTPPARPPPPKFQKDEHEKEAVHPVPSPRRVGQALTRSCLENSVAYMSSGIMIILKITLESDKNSQII